MYRVSMSFESLAPMGDEVKVKCVVDRDCVRLPRKKRVTFAPDVVSPPQRAGTTRSGRIVKRSLSSK